MTRSEENNKVETEEKSPNRGKRKRQTLSCYHFISACEKKNIRREIKRLDIVRYIEQFDPFVVSNRFLQLLNVLHFIRTRVTSSDDAKTNIVFVLGEEFEDFNGPDLVLARTHDSNVEYGKGARRRGGDGG